MPTSCAFLVALWEEPSDRFLLFFSRIVNFA